MPASFICIDQGRGRRPDFDIAHAPALCSVPLLPSWSLCGLGAPSDRAWSPKEILKLPDDCALPGPTLGFRGTRGHLRLGTVQPSLPSGASKKSRPIWFDISRFSPELCHVAKPCPNPVRRRIERRLRNWRPVSHHIPKFATGTLKRMAGMGAQDNFRRCRPASRPCLNSSPNQVVLSAGIWRGACECELV